MLALGIILILFAAGLLVALAFAPGSASAALQFAGISSILSLNPSDFEVFGCFTVQSF